MKEKILEGVCGAKGIITGKVVVFEPDKIKIDYKPVKDVKAESLRFEKVRKKIISEWKKISYGWRGNISRVLDAQIMILEDKEFVSKVKEKIKQERMRVESAFLETLEQFLKNLDESENELFKERAQEIRYLGKRIVLEMQGQEGFIPVDSGSILVTDDLLPVDILELRNKKPVGVVTEKGGATSHTVILARQLEIPMICGIKNLLKDAKDGKDAILDGWNGKLILDPSKSTLQQYEEKIKKVEILVDKFVKKKPPKSKERKKISVLGNIGMFDDIKTIKKYDGQGVGLFRTEISVWDPIRWRDENYQTEIYQSCAQEIFPDPLVVRLLDVGAGRYLPGYPEKNPFLGVRGIRFLMKEKEILRTQLRSILKSSGMGNVRILLPMVTIVEEIQAIKKYLEKLKKELKVERVPFDNYISVGIMVEVPSVALMAEKIAPHVDFFSVGTNDLTQYLFGVDRTNSNVAYLYNDFHPAVFRLVSSVVKGAHQFRKRVCVCGEIASDPIGAVVLMGLGIDELSVHPSDIPFIREVVTRVEYKKSKELAKKVLEMNNSREVKDEAKEFIKKHVPKVAEIMLG
jgi:phosphotransferase system enzyme I (PtsI)